jgi:hypothetical protein
MKAPVESDFLDFHVAARLFLCAVFQTSAPFVFSEKLSLRRALFAQEAHSE